MKVDLFQSNKSGYYEIWVDGKFLKSIDKVKGETTAQYKERAEKEIEDYVDKVSKIEQQKRSSGTVKKSFDI